MWCRSVVFNSILSKKFFQLSFNKFSSIISDYFFSESKTKIIQYAVEIVECIGRTSIHLEGASIIINYIWPMNDRSIWVWHGWRGATGVADELVWQSVQHLTLSSISPSRPGHQTNIPAKQVKEYLLYFHTGYNHLV